MRPKSMDSKSGTNQPVQAEALQGITESALWYDRSINWQARFERELPLLCDWFGAPNEQRLIDAGCGTGRHALAMAQAGFEVVGIDLSEPMLALARELSAEHDPAIRFEQCAFEQMADRVGSGFGGLFCLGNSLAAAGSAAAVRASIQNFAAVLDGGGRLLVQILNFPPMWEERPCVRGPRCVVLDDSEYVSVRLFHFSDDQDAGPSGRADISNITMWKEGKWRQESRAGRLYPVTFDELSNWFTESGLTIRETYGAYDQRPFDPESSVDLIVLAEKKT